MFKLLKILMFYWKELLKQLKMNQKLLGILGTGLLGNMLARIAIVRAGSENM